MLEQYGSSLKSVRGQVDRLMFLKMLEAHQLDEQLFARIGAYLAAEGLRVSRGTIVDAHHPCVRGTWESISGAERIVGMRL